MWLSRRALQHPSGSGEHVQSTSQVYPPGFCLISFVTPSSLFLMLLVVLQTCQLSLVQAFAFCLAWKLLPSDDFKVFPSLQFKCHLLREVSLEATSINSLFIALSSHLPCFIFFDITHYYTFHNILYEFLFITYLLHSDTEGCPKNVERVNE